MARTASVADSNSESAAGPSARARSKAARPSTKSSADKAAGFGADDGTGEAFKLVEGVDYKLLKERPPMRKGEGKKGYLRRMARITLRNQYGTIVPFGNGGGYCVAMAGGDLEVVPRIVTSGPAPNRSRKAAVLVAEDADAAAARRLRSGMEAEGQASGPAPAGRASTGRGRGRGKGRGRGGRGESAERARGRGGSVRAGQKRKALNTIDEEINDDSEAATGGEGNDDGNTPAPAPRPSTAQTTKRGRPKGAATQATTNEGDAAEAPKHRKAAAAAARPAAKKSKTVPTDKSTENTTAPAEAQAWNAAGSTNDDALAGDGEGVASAGQVSNGVSSDEDDDPYRPYARADIQNAAKSGDADGGTSSSHSNRANGQSDATSAANAAALATPSPKARTRRSSSYSTPPPRRRARASTSVERTPRPGSA
ncbi:hypothetical protein BDZ91DRAFT_105662 [Kalaharituber pfeilii]|nr:hypothetical protein BDZ91DRAFT_105662 [Kalaharituber pfeilii]